MTQVKFTSLDTDNFHVEQVLGPDWESDEALEHIQKRIRHLAVPIDTLIEDPSNVRVHPDDNLEGIRGSYAKYKQRVLLVVNVRTMIVEKGNGSLRSLRSGGFKFAAVLFVDDDPATATGFAIADNRTAEQATWNLEGLFKQLKTLKESDYEVPGVDDAFFDELKTLTQATLFVDPPDPQGEDPGAGAKPKDPVSVLGTVYQLGKHRILCGDSTKREDVEKLLGEDRVQLTCTDPPYGVDYEGGTKDKLSIENDDLGTEETRELWASSLGLACSFSRDGASCYVFTPTRPDVLIATMPGWQDSGFLAKHLLVWNKNALVLGRCDYHYKHEGLFYGWKPGAAHFFVDDRTQTTVLDFAKPSRNEEHPTMKPVDLVEKLVSNSSKQGWIVYDPFAGSGTCLIACARTSRVFRGIELDPRYVDVIRKRWGEYARSVGVAPGKDAL